MTRIISSEDSKNVGRPGFGKMVPGPTGKDSVRTLRVNDPADGRTQPAANKITTTHIDLIGNQSPATLGKHGNTPFASGRKTVKTPRKSAPKKR